MKRTAASRLLALLLCILLLTACLPTAAFAESDDTTVAMTEGDVIAGFAPTDAVCTSSDPSIAWVDENGSLNAMKPGEAAINVTSADGAQTEYTVTVGDYADGSEIVGSLKLLARYNDSMQFYDGHVYLLFTSYQDGVEITVPDLYAGYEISDAYYTDIREDIANGSNHTGSDTDRYFTYNDRMTSVTLDRGEIVTIGMYRGFDLTVPQAALGSIRNCSLWNELEAAGKATVIEAIFGVLDSGKISADEAAAKLKAVFDEAGLDYNKLMDGVVEGGVCFNRELYNQKLEWDQYENVTYELDITRNQLNTLVAHLDGNLNKFSILKNSCATVALRAWNAAVGTRNGADTSYKLTSAGEGIFAVIDAPKGVRDSIVGRLPGYYLNNADGVAEPDAGYRDETGWVYVSAPEIVSPAALVYADDSLMIDEKRTKPAALINAAKAGRQLSYNKEEQQIGVTIKTSDSDGATVIDGVDFNVNGATVSLTAENAPEDGIWFKKHIGDPDDGNDHYVTDTNGSALPSVYEDGWLSFYAASLPAAFTVVGSADGTKNRIRIISVGCDDPNEQTTVYRKDGEKSIPLNDLAEVNSGADIYIKASMPATSFRHLVTDITMNGVSIFDDAHFDAEENAYHTVMPEEYSTLRITYGTAAVTVGEHNRIQVFVGDELPVEKYAQLSIDGVPAGKDSIEWKPVYNIEGALAFDDGDPKAIKKGFAILMACAKGNENIFAMLIVEVLESADDAVTVTYSTDEDSSLIVMAKDGDQPEAAIPYSGYYVKKGTELTLMPVPGSSKAVLYTFVNGCPLKKGDAIIADQDTDITVRFADAVIEGMPDTVNLDAEGETCQLYAKVRYSGLLKYLSVYDSDVLYVSSDPLITVDETGLITVAGEIPEGGKAVYVTAYAGSSNKSVYARTKVIVGDYQGGRIVGRLTISARPIVKAQLVAHGALTFTTYEDVDMDVSFYNYYQPNEKYNALMRDYEEHPENYASDPALYNDNELGLTDRESYFDTYSNGAGSEPQTISMQAGESITISNYGYDRTNLTTMLKALSGGAISTDQQAQELVRQMELFDQGEEIDGAAAFDSLVATLVKMYLITNVTGSTPATGHSEGGMDINREMYNQFRRDDSQMPNNYYAIDITADELAVLQAYLSDPDNNYYSLFAKNCATGVVDIWNTVLADKPELRLTANLTGFASDPESLYFELGKLRCKQGLPGEGGTDFYPRTVAYSDAVLDTIDKIGAIGEVEGTPECKAKIDAARAAYDALTQPQKEQVRNYQTLLDAESAYQAIISPEPAITPILGDADGDGEVTILDATVIQRILSSIPDDNYNAALADVDGDGEVTIIDATYIQRSLAGLSCPDGIGKPIEKA